MPARHGSRSGEAGGPSTWNDGPPSPSRDRDGIGRCGL